MVRLDVEWEKHKAESKAKKKFDIDAPKYKKLLDPNRETEKIKVKFLKDYGTYKKDEERFIPSRDYVLMQERDICEAIDNNTPTEKAWSDFRRINELKTVNQQHREWLKAYVGLIFTSATNGKYTEQYKQNPKFYDDSFYSQDINQIARKKDRLVAEFDALEGEPDNPKESLEFTKQLFEKFGIGFIQSTHESKNSDYLWVEFTREITTEEGQQFLAWLQPNGSRIDLNFTSDEKVFPVMFAKHWKYSDKRELPIGFFEGRKIDYDALNIKLKKINKSVVNKNGISYTTSTSKKNPYAIFGVVGQVENFYESKPFFYNKSGMFFIWDTELKKYDMSDDVDMLNGISDLGMDTINSKNKQEILNALKQFGRRKVPKDAPVTWIQFKNKIVDVKSGEEFEASPEYFMTNPLPYSPSDCDDTPTIDKLFGQWAGKKYVKTLHQISAYSCGRDQFMQRLIALIGGGSNGKGTYIKLLNKLVGRDNSCSSELKELCNSGFETSMIYKKLVCVLGEISQGDLKNTNQIKKLAGEDEIRFCFKGKTAFSEMSSTTLLSLTNSLPKTPDKTMGFYRKWIIVDFPNQFTEINCDILGEIPEEEFNNWARKCLNILKELYKNKKFENEGSFQERMDRYEERSNPLGKFIEDYCEEELGGQYILNEFTKDFNEFAKKNHIQIQTVRQIGKILRDDGLEIKPRSIILDDKSKVSHKVILNIIKKTTETTRTTINSNSFPCRVSVDNHGSSGSSGSFKRKPLELIQPLTEENCLKEGYTVQEIKDYLDGKHK